MALTMRRRALLGLPLLLLRPRSSRAAERQAPSSLEGLVLRGPDGKSLYVSAAVHGSRFTAIVCYSATCPCFAAHRERLAGLHRELAPRGVRFLLVDSERHTDGDAVPANLDGLPVLRDEGARLARALGARYATESFVFDAAGALRYRGGIDDERKSLGPSPKTYLRDGLQSLLAGTAPALVTTKSLGCVLRLN